MFWKLSKAVKKLQKLALVLTNSSIDYNYPIGTTLGAGIIQSQMKLRFYRSTWYIKGLIVFKPPYIIMNGSL